MTTVYLKEIVKEVKVNTRDCKREKKLPRRVGNKCNNYFKEVVKKVTLNSKRW